MKVLDLFSGIGGFSYAAERLVGGFETIGFCEIDPFCQKVLKKHWPAVPIYTDVKELANEANRFRGLVDVVCGGYPCQPFSVASANRKGQEDDRHLWPEMLRIIQGARPRFVIGENVAGHITLGLDDVLSDLEAEGYTARAFVIPACAKDARHRRDRVWVVAHTDSHGKSNGSQHEQRMVGNAQHNGSSAPEVSGSHRKDDAGSSEGQEKAKQFEGTGQPRSDADVAHTTGGKRNARSEKCEALQTMPADGRKRNYSGGSGAAYTEAMAYTDNAGCQEQWRSESARAEQQAAQCGSWWEPEPRILRVVNGLPNRVDRIRSLGNSIVPQVAAEIFTAIKAMANGQEE